MSDQELAPFDGSLVTSNPRRVQRRSATTAVLSLVLGTLAATQVLPIALIAPCVLALMLAVTRFTLAHRDPSETLRDRGTDGVLWLEDADVVFQATGEDTPRLRIPRDDIVDGWMEPYESDTGNVLVLQRRDGTEMRLARDHGWFATEKLLGELGVDERATQLNLAADPRGVRGCMGAFMGLMLVLGLIPLVSAPIAALLLGQPSLIVAMILPTIVFLGPILAMPHFLVPNRVVVGRDGVLLKQFLRRRRFISFDELRDASAGPAAVVLERNDGRLRTVRASEWAAATAALLINDRLQRYHGGDAEHAIAALERGERSIDDYRAMLGELLAEGRASFRRGVVHAEDLLRVVADPRASPTQRVGAAYALSRHDDAAAEKLRVAVEGCAEPRLRVALEGAADGELDEEALAEAEHEARARQC